MPKAYADEPTSLLTYLGAIGLSSDPLPPSVVFSAVLFGLVLAFQVGYFQVVGIEILPQISLSDLGFTAGAIWVSWSLALLLGSELRKLVGEKYRSSQLEEWPIWKLVRRVNNLPIIAVLVVVVVSAFSKIDFLMPLQVAGVLAMYVSLIVLLEIVKHEVEYWGCAKGPTLINLTWHLALIMLLIGTLYAEGNGRHCWYRVDSNGYLKAEYLRPLGDGHLFRRDGKTIYITKTELKEISFANPEHEKAHLKKQPVPNGTDPGRWI